MFVMAMVKVMVVMLIGGDKIGLVITCVIDYRQKK